ncbi:hypothetical protein F4802DRAFT_217070 [Xylaria palmicola]|nr:hypothetical protein F4802DRAFT_217070 [Xylaria palmicola]
MNQQQPNQPPQGQPPYRLLRPDNIRTLQYLTPHEKQRYMEGLTTLWAKVEQNPPGSEEHNSAKMKIAEFTRMVLNKVKTIHMRQAQPNNQAGPQGLQGPQQQANQGTQAQGQGPVQGPTQAQTPVQGPSSAQAPAQVPAPTQAQLQAQAQPTPNQVHAAAPQKSAMPPNRPPAPAANNPSNPPSLATNKPPGNVLPVMTQQTVPKHIIDHMGKLPWIHFPIPSQFSHSLEQTQKYLNESKTRYMRALIQMEATKSRTVKIDAMIKEKQETGSSFSPDEVKRFQETKLSDKKSYTEADAFVKNVRNQLMVAQAAAQGNGARGPAAVQPGRSQPMQPANSGGVASAHPMQIPTASINAAMDAAKTTQIAAANRAGSVGGAQQQHAQPQQQPPSNFAQAKTPVTPATPSTTAPGQAPHLATAPAPAMTQVKIEPSPSTQHLPPVNTALAAASNTHMQSAGTPTQTPARVQTPQSGQQAPSASVLPLTHAAAVSRANSSSNPTGQPNNSSGGMVNNASNLTGMATQPGHSHAHPQPAAPTLTHKMPIPKHLPEKAIVPPAPLAVGGGNTPGRPTYGGGSGSGGVINQPVIAKMPVPQFDTEGDHVLSKKKLDELVRQVCGGGSPGADGNYLTPDVEESVLTVADNFVDNVLHMACQLAKERGSKVLEIRDIQLVLERVYNIRIPGYTSDELRTVRKVQPSPNWIAKMSAIQAAKVTSGKDDK